MEALHLVKRFFASLRSRAPATEDEAWLLGMLSPAEAELYHRQPPLDRWHSVDCGLKARRVLGERATTPVIVAAALHDVGKADAGLGTFGRVGATVAARFVPRSRLCGWEERPGLRGRVARYVLHDQWGARMLLDAGSHPLVVAWAGEHHDPPDQWSIDAATGEVLAEADK